MEQQIMEQPMEEEVPMVDSMREMPKLMSQHTELLVTKNRLAEEGRSKCFLFNGLKNNYVSMIKRLSEISTDTEEKQKLKVEIEALRTRMKAIATECNNIRMTLYRLEPVFVKVSRAIGEIHYADNS